MSGFRVPEIEIMDLKAENARLRERVARAEGNIERLAAAMVSKSRLGWESITLGRTTLGHLFGVIQVHPTEAEARAFVVRCHGLDVAPAGEKGGSP